MGRVILSRSSGKNLYFYTLTVDGVNFQVMSDVKSYGEGNEENFYEIHGMIARGDIIGVHGYIARTFNCTG